MTDHPTDFIEDRLKDAYRDYLRDLSEEELALKLGRLVLEETLIEMIIERDPTGEYDPGFEDIRNNL